MKIRQTSVSDAAKKSYYKYAMMVNEDRSIPTSLEGLKPSGRRALWTLFTLGLHSKAPYMKTARAVGECFLAETKVSTSKGKIPIEDLLIGDVVNTSRGPRKIIGLIKNPPVLMYELSTTDGKSVVLTRDQCVKIKIGTRFFWKKACELTDKDQIVTEI